jgi:site-specific recombinase XerD
MALAPAPRNGSNGARAASQQVTTWDDALGEYLLHLKATRAPKTARFYETQLRQLALWCEDENIPFLGFGKRHLDRFLVFRQEAGKSPTTLKHDAVACKAFFRWCARNDLIDRSPLAEYQVRNAPEPAKHMPSDEEIVGLLKAVRDHFSTSTNPAMRFFPAARRTFHRERDHALLLGLVDTACRIGEMLSLKLGDVDRSQRQVLIRQAKGRKPRTLPVSPEWLQALEGWLKVRERLMQGAEEDEGYLFVSEYGGRMDESSFLKSVKRAAAWAGLPDTITLHSLRRYSLNRLAKHNLLGAQQIAGHRNPQTTLLYTRLDADFVRDVHEGTGVVKNLLASNREKRRKKLV